MLLDEPTNGVDLAARSAIHAVLQRLREAGTAILIATHDFPEAERLADRSPSSPRGGSSGRGGWPTSSPACAPGRRSGS